MNQHIRNNKHPPFSILYYTVLSLTKIKQLQEKAIIDRTTI